jgi:hypothetical protein
VGCVALQVRCCAGCRVVGSVPVQVGNMLTCLLDCLCDVGSPGCLVSSCLANDGGFLQGRHCTFAECCVQNMDGKFQIERYTGRFACSSLVTGDAKPLLCCVWYCAVPQSMLVHQQGSTYMTKHEYARNR